MITYYSLYYFEFREVIIIWINDVMFELIDYKFN